MRCLHRSGRDWSTAGRSPESRGLLSDKGLGYRPQSHTALLQNTYHTHPKYFQGFLGSQAFPGTASLLRTVWNNIQAPKLCHILTPSSRTRYTTLIVKIIPLFHRQLLQSFTPPSPTAAVSPLPPLEMALQIWAWVFIPHHPKLARHSSGWCSPRQYFTEITPSTDTELPEKPKTLQWAPLARYQEEVFTVTGAIATKSWWKVFCANGYLHKGDETKGLLRLSGIFAVFTRYPQSCGQIPAGLITIIIPLHIPPATTNGYRACLGFFLPRVLVQVSV